MPPPLRPFPLPSLSIGTDIAHIPRMAKLVASQRTLPRFLRKLFTSREERTFHLRFPLHRPSFESDSGSSSEGGEQQRTEDAAARPEVRRATREEGEAASEALAGQSGEDEDIPGQVVKISISHDGDYATAVCLAADETNEML
ncbi:hypothetical protein Q7P35_008808 [Cladosporium inversicolor]